MVSNSTVSPNTGTEESASSKSNEHQYLYSEAYKPPFWPALIVVFPILPFFWMYHVTLNNDVNDNNGQKLSFGYTTGLVKETIETSHIATVEPVTHINGLLHWGGWGLRKNLRWETGYITKNGPGVKLTLKKEHGGKVFVFNCDDPEKLCQLLQTKTKQTGGVQAR